MRSEDKYAEFYERTGINLTNQPIGKLPESLKEEANYIYENLYRKAQKLIPRIQKLIKKYPNIPSLKNYLYSAYMLTDKEEQATKVLNLTLEKHPKYIFGITSMIESLNEAEELKKHEHLLGNPRSILSFHSKDEKIHISEYLAYQSAACHFEAYTGDIESAKKRLSDLMELGVEKEVLSKIARKISIGRMTNNIMKLKEESEKEIRVTVVPKLQFDYTEEPPVLQHNLLLDLFYNNSTEEFTIEQINQVMALPKESLIKDLERIVEDAIRRQPFFKDEGFDDKTHEFLIHALYFLGALKATQSLDTVLHLLRTEEEVLEYWLGGYKEETFFPTMYLIGENQLERLKAFALEENNEGFNRSKVTDVVAQVALHQPARREEVIHWFKEVLEYHLQHPDNKGIIDSRFLMVCVSKLLDIRAKELLPIIRALFEKGWIPASFVGDLAEVENEMERPFEKYRIAPVPHDIYEFYSKAYEERKVPYSKNPFEELEESFPEVVIDDPVEQLINEAMFGSSGRFQGMSPEEEDYDDYEEEEEEGYLPSPVKTIVRDSPKLGRNDPCECGSGKKYKHCCLRN